MQYAVPQRVFAAAPQVCENAPTWQSRTRMNDTHKFRMNTNHRRQKPAQILLADDDPTAARLIGIALKRTGVPHELAVVTDGDQAINVLRKDSPDLLLLDLYMPGKNGFEVLEHLKAHKHLRGIPVIMLSSSGSQADINRAYDLHVNAYVLKHTDFAELSRTLDSIVNFWLGTAMTPSGNAGA